MTQFAQMITRFFPLVALFFVGIAWFVPEPLVALKPSIIYLLGLIMFGMGISLTIDDFKRAITNRKALAFGTGMQFLLMPLLAFILAVVFKLPEMLFIGMILVGTSPGGTASNVMCYLAKGDVALSITLTAISTLIAIVATPLLTELYAGQTVDVPMTKMLVDIAKIIVLPVGVGLLLNTFFSARLKTVQQIFPAISVIAISLIIGIVVALNHERIGSLSMVLFIAVILHNLIGLLGTYWLSGLFGWDIRTRKTLAIEVGMQNSGLAVFMGVKYFAPLSALPGAIFSIWHNLSGSIFASYMRNKQ
ncbi:MAG: Sodium-dependent transporter [uncultured Thiotrichaceae bacterium]|uniref:Sodium-dependent transporter n=1 Tax=uncultured Thiotrichaceae bacterium TaxID=298394 RepID=A0A6S6TDT7_9GAMM|nr:MAG: Sodium-dependent transporter [uncultured Thiotrichaceae bacterium]